MPTSDHIKRLMGSSSWIRRMFEEGIELKKQIGAENVFDFSLGNPITEPPKPFLKKLKELGDNPVKGLHRYMPNLGFNSTREKIAKYYSKEFNKTVGKEDVIVTVGAAGGINVLLKSLLDPANEVIVFSPYFVEYKFYADNHQGRLVVLPTDENFEPDLEALKWSINYETVAILLNTPNNPTGKMYSEQFYKKLVQIVRDKSEELGRVIYIVTDEPYRKIVYEKKNISIFDHYEYSVFITSHSKDLSLAGDRIGYAILNPDMPNKGKLMDAMAFCNRILGYVNAPATIQYLVEDILDQSVDINDYKEKRDLLYNALTEAGYEVNKPDGAFYFFVKNPMGDDDIAWVKHLKKYNILAVPGIGFGKRGYFRLSYAVDTDMVKRSLPYFKKAIESLNL